MKALLKARVPLAIVVVAAVVAGFVLWPAHTPRRRLTAHFTAAVGVFPGSDVRVLGVRVGEVAAVVPEGRSVRVELSYDSRYAIPADAQAVIVPPSVVSDRYVQLSPAYAGGPVLVDGADLPTNRTTVPIEIDEIFRSLDELDRALGPGGANADGALAEVVATARENLAGNGELLHDTLRDLGSTLSTLADGRDDLFGSLGNLAELSAALAASDQQVRELNGRLADVGGELAAERDDLASAVRTLAVALADIRAFVRDNREALVANVAALADLTGVLVRQQRALMEVLDVAPLALTNLFRAYNPASGTLDTRDDVTGPYDPAAYVCSLMANVVPTAQIPQTCFDLAKLLADRGLPLTDELRRLLTVLPVPVADTSPDGTLGGILRGGS